MSKKSKASITSDNSTASSDFQIDTTNHDGYFNDKGEYIRRYGIHWIVTGLFLVGDIAGGGLVALPTAVTRAQFWPGLIYLILMAAVTGFTSYILGLSWMILIRQFPEYRAHTRQPYPEMGYRALGRKVQIFVSICIDITQFGVSVVYILLSSKSINDFMDSVFDVNISYCVVILVVAVVLLPVTFLKSPQDFWPAIVIGMFTTGIAVVLILVSASLDYGTCSSEGRKVEFTITNYLMATGTIIFSYGGHASFPTIQHDMKKPEEFSKSTVLAFSLCAAMYIPVSVLSYLTYGDSLRDSIINSLQTPWIQTTVNMLIAVHCILTTVIVINPLNQELEEFFNVPHEFSFKRIIVRTACMVSLVFVAESIPNFGPLIDFVGGALQSFNCVILPCLFYLFLNAAEKNHRKNGKKDGKNNMERVSWREAIDHHQDNKLTLYLCIFIVILGFIGGITATYTAVEELAYAKFVAPCYVQPFLEKAKVFRQSTTNCCGHYQNISRLPEGYYCAAPKLDYYLA